MDPYQVKDAADQAIAETELLLDVSAVALRLNVSTWTVRRWAKHGKIIVVRTPTNGYRVPRSELQRILSTRACNTCSVSTP